MQKKIDYVGVDGCWKAWFAIGLSEEGDWEPKRFESIEELWNYYERAKLILIDIPIGLEENKPLRLCDCKARQFLVRRWQSVFATPCRTAVESYSDIKEQKAISEINKRETGKGISCFCMGIIPKINKVDNFLINNPSVRKKPS